jgi:hypothetical protein
VSSFQPVAAQRPRPFGYSFVADRDLGYRGHERVEVHVFDPPSTLFEAQRAELRYEFVARGRALLAAPTETTGLLRTLAVDDALAPRWVTEYRPTLPLAEARRRAAAPLEPSGALSIALDVLEGLAVVHARRYPWGEALLFGDVAADAVLLDEAGRAQLDPLAGLRWGLGFDPDAGPPSVRFQHCSPARICGDPPSLHDEIFSVGSLLGALLIGQPVFWGESDTATLRQIMEADVRRFESLARDLPRALVLAVSTALSRRPERRFESARAFAEALGAAADRARVVPSPEAALRWALARRDPSVA